jgi:type VI protein secretion system component Hcp
MNAAPRIAALLVLLALNIGVALGGTSLYLDVPAIPGPGSPQKYPTSLELDSFSWAPKGKSFDVGRISDSNTSAFQAYQLNGHVLHDVSALFYKTHNEMHDPYLTFTFSDARVTSLSFSVFGNMQKEKIQFQYDTGKAIYLKLPGQPGDSSPPGYLNVRSLDSIGFDSTGLTITEDVTASSQALAAAVASSTDFGAASLLFYDVPAGSDTPVDPPYEIMSLSDLTGTSYQTIVGTDPSTEQITFSYSDFNGVPEPGIICLVGAGIGAGTLRRSARRAQ